MNGETCPICGSGEIEPGEKVAECPDCERTIPLA